MKYIRQNYGFTLIELLIGISIFAFIAAGAAGILSSSAFTYRYTLEEAANEQDARSILQAIAHELRNASKIETPAFQTSGSQTSSTVIEYFTASETQKRSIFLGSGDEAYSVVFANPNQSNNSRIIKGKGRIQQLTFTRDSLNKRKVHIDIAMQNQKAGNFPAAQFSDTVMTLGNIQ